MWGGGSVSSRRVESQRVQTQWLVPERPPLARLSLPQRLSRCGRRNQRERSRTLDETNSVRPHAAAAAATMPLSTDVTVKIVVMTHCVAGKKISPNKCSHRITHASEV